MEKTMYVLVYPNDKFLRIDFDSGYPFEVDDSPHIWYDYDEAKKYADIFPDLHIEVRGLEYVLNKVK